MEWIQFNADTNLYELHNKHYGVIEESNDRQFLHDLMVMAEETFRQNGVDLDNIYE